MVTLAQPILGPETPPPSVPAQTTDSLSLSISKPINTTNSRESTMLLHHGFKPTGWSVKNALQQKHPQIQHNLLSPHDTQIRAHSTRKRDESLCPNANCKPASTRTEPKNTTCQNTETEKHESALTKPSLARGHTELAKAEQRAAPLTLVFPFIVTSYVVYAAYVLVRGDFYTLVCT